MDLESVIQTIRELLPELKLRHAVDSIGVFGSLARGEAQSESDVDVFVRFDPEARVTLATMARVKVLLEFRLAANVDLVDDHPHLSRSFRRAVERDLVRVA
jgi:predicted nucleotidyltransferase